MVSNVSKDSLHASLNLGENVHKMADKTSTIFPFDGIVKP